MNDDSFEESVAQDGPNFFDSIGLGNAWMYRIRGTTLQAIEEMGYQIAPEELGRGASSIVLGATQPEIGHRVAIKVIVEPDQPAVMQQFDRERKVLASNVIPSGIAPTYVTSFVRDGGQPVLIMERVLGEAITSYVKRRELPVNDRINLIEKLLEALSRLHACNLIHGDPSPNNILVDSRGGIRLIDFGNSRRWMAGYESTLDLRSKSGTPSIAPTEQIEGELAPCPLTDLYSAASIAYLVLTGETRLAVGTDDANAFHHNRLMAQNVPSWFATILIRMMQRPLHPGTALDTQNRYSNISEVIHEIQQARAKSDAKKMLRRRASIVAVTLPLLVIFFAWCLASLYQSRFESKRTARNSIQAQIRYALRNLQATNLPNDTGVLSQLMDEQASWESDDILLISDSEFKLKENHVSLLLMEAMLQDSRLNVALPSLNLMEKCFKSTHWVQTSDLHRSQCQDFEDDLTQFRERVSIGMTLGIREDCRQLESRLKELLDSNILAEKAETARDEFISERDLLPKHLHRIPAYMGVNAFEEAGKEAWENAAFESAFCSYSDALDAILELRAEYESQADEAVHAAMLSEKQTHNQRLVNHLRTQLQQSQENLLRKTAELTTTQRQCQELSSRLISNFQECDGCETECQGDWSNGWFSPTEPSAIAPEGVSEVLMSKALLQEELEHTQQRVSTLELILERTIQGPFASPTPAPAIASRSAIDSIQPLGPPTQPQSREHSNEQNPNPVTPPIDLLHWIESAETLKQRDEKHPFHPTDLSPPRPGQSSQLNIAGVPVAFRYCPPCDPGTFCVGSPVGESGREMDENPAFRWFEHGFWIMQTECTNELWHAVMGLPSREDAAVHLPITDVSFDECVDFINRANRLLAQQSERLGTYHFSLPSETEWEYACRAGSNTPYAFGDDSDLLADYGWYDANSSGRLQPVGTKRPNVWGIHDMHGSAWEWTYSAYSLRHSEAPFPWDSTQTAPDAPRVTRGGGISSPATLCRSASRSLFVPSLYQSHQGFRMVVRPESVASHFPHP
jgi:serine/threonine protein kinase